MSLVKEADVFCPMHVCLAIRTPLTLWRNWNITLSATAIIPLFCWSRCVGVPHETHPDSDYNLVMHVADVNIWMQS